MRKATKALLATLAQFAALLVVGVVIGYFGGDQIDQRRCSAKEQSAKATDEGAGAQALLVVSLDALVAGLDAEPESGTCNALEAQALRRTRRDAASELYVRLFETAAGTPEGHLDAVAHVEEAFRRMNRAAGEYQTVVSGGLPAEEVLPYARGYMFMLNDVVRASDQFILNVIHVYRPGLEHAQKGNREQIERLKELLMKNPPNAETVQRDIVKLQTAQQRIDTSLAELKLQQDWATRQKKEFARYLEPAASRVTTLEHLIATDQARKVVKESFDAAPVVPAPVIEEVPPKPILPAAPVQPTAVPSVP